MRSYKAFDEFMDNLQNENALEQDKPIKSTGGVGYELLKKMGYEEGKGLRTTQEGILEFLLVTKLPKHMGLDHAIKFIKDNPPQGLGTEDLSRKLKGDIDFLVLPFSQILYLKFAF